MYPICGFGSFSFLNVDILSIWKNDTEDQKDYLSTQRIIKKYILLLLI